MTRLYRKGLAVPHGFDPLVRRYAKVAPRRAAAQRIAQKLADGPETSETRRLAAHVGVTVPATFPGLWGRVSVEEAAKVFARAGTKRPTGYQVISVPVYDLPDRVAGIVAFAEDGVRSGGWKDPDRAVGVAFAPVLHSGIPADAPASWDGRTVVAPDVPSAFRVFNAARVLSPGRVPPVLALVGDAASAAAAAAIVPSRAVTWVGPGEFWQFRVAHAAGLDVALVDRREVGQDPMGFCNSVLKYARPWPQALKEQLDRTPPREAAAALAGVWDVEMAAACPPAVTDRTWSIYRLASRLPPVYGVGPYILRESDAGWSDAVTGRILSDTVIVVESVQAPPDADDTVYAVEVRRRGKSARFTEPGSRVRADVVGRVELACVRAGLGVPYVDPGFVPYYLAAALAVRPPSPR